MYIGLGTATLFGLYLYYNESRYGEQKRKLEKENRKKEIELEKEKYKNLNKNRFGIATNPAESLEVFSEFVTNGYAIEKLSDFNEHEIPRKIS